MTAVYDPCAGCPYAEAAVCLLSGEEPCPKKLKEEQPPKKEAIPVNYEAVETD